MVEIKLPYDKKTIVAKIPDENFAGLLESKAENFHNPLSEEETVERSLDNPIGSRAYLGCYWFPPSFNSLRIDQQIRPRNR